MNKLFLRMLKTSFFLLFLSVFNINLYGQNQDSPIIITEFLASNDGVLLDKDGDSPDWIEIFNRSDETISLEGWSLTDDSDDLSKWEFPNMSMLSGEFRIIFASKKDRNNPDEELHTNFKLSAKGEYLALIEGDKVTVASEFAPVFMPQYENMSYGFIQNVTTSVFVGAETAAKLLIPSNNNLNLTWTGLPDNETFYDTDWQSVISGIGYDKTLPVLRKENIAPLGVASQSSEWEGLPASFVNDNLYDNFSHTATGDFSPWLDISFNTTQTFGEIVLFNRSNCCQERLYNITIEISNAQNEIIYTSDLLNGYQEGETPVSPGNTMTLNLLDVAPYGVKGTKIRISKSPLSDAREYIQLAEVHVYGVEQSYSKDINSDIETEMFGVNSSAYIRYPFTIVDEKAFNALSLKMKYDDGFIAYINGVKVASGNISTGTPSFNDTANTTHLAHSFELNVLSIDVLKQGENILAIQGFNVSQDDLSFFIQPELQALQIDTNPTQVYFTKPTPGTYNNSEGFYDLITDNQSDFSRGFYDESFELTISNNTPGTTIIYTTDGSDPSEENGIVVLPSDPTAIASTTILIDKTTVVRMLTIKEFYRSTDIDTNTYIFIEDVISSDVMDKSITEDPTYRFQMKKALTDLPTISIVTDTDAINKETDVFASMELIFPNGETGFQENAGISNYGGYYTTFDKLNFRLYFKSKYGASKLKFPLFEGHEHGIDAVSVFDQLDLRAGSHDMEMRGFYMSNRFTDDTMLDMGNLNPHGQFVHVYLNGVYWGQYHLRERWNADMHAQYLGGEKEDYEAINGNKNLGGWAPNDTPYDGDGVAWERVKSLRGSFTEVSPYLDVEHYIDYMLLYMFGNSENEYRTVGPIGTGSGFKFYHNDADGFLRDTGNRTAMGQPGQKHADGPASIFSMLFKEASPVFKTLLADRIHKHFFNNGVLTPEKIEERLLERCYQVETSMIAESARWGYRTPDSWEASVNDYLTDVAPYRTNTVINHFINAGFYPSIQAPQLNINNIEHYGGEVEIKDLLSLTTNYGDIYYTLDGIDPYMPSENTAQLDLVTLVNQDTQKTVFVPTEILPTGWNSNVNFDDSKWINGTGSFGYERSQNGNTIDIDLENEMYDKQLGALARIKFDIDNLNDIKQLLLYLSYDDGVIVYLNGEEVVRINAPSGTILYNSGALSSSEASSLATFNISEYINHLKIGANILAIHAMNLSVTSSDFYNSTELVVDISDDIDNGISPSAIKYDGEPIEVNETVLVKARAVKNTQWSALSEANYLIEDLTVDEPDYLNAKSYPNPFNEGFNISFNSVVDAEASLKIYDATGRVIWYKEFDVESNILSSIYVDTSFWSSGFYIYQIELSSGELLSGKLICTKR